MSRFPIPAPRSDEGTVVPAALVGVLTVMIVLQLWLTRTDTPVPLPEAVPILAAYTPPKIMTVTVAPAILNQPIFSPARTQDGGNDADPDMLAGAQVAGTWTVGHRSQLVLRKADGGAITIAPGQTFNGWQLAGITGEGARFVREGQSELIPFGASAPRSKAAGEDQSEEEQQ